MDHTAIDVIDDPKPSRHIGCVEDWHHRNQDLDPVVRAWVQLNKADDSADLASVSAVELAKPRE